MHMHVNILRIRIFHIFVLWHYITYEAACILHIVIIPLKKGIYPTTIYLTNREDQAL